MIDNDRIDELTSLCVPVQQWLLRNGHPHTEVVISQSDAEVKEGLAMVKFSEGGD